MEVGNIALLAGGILLARPVRQAPAISTFVTRGDGPVFAGSLFAFLFITIASWALSGFHSRIASGISPTLLETERQMRRVGSGGADRRTRRHRSRIRQQPRPARRADHRRTARRARQEHR